MSHLQKIKSKYLLWFSLALTLFTFFLIWEYVHQNTTPIRIASGGNWISLHPGLQHTVYADMVLSNQFDALIGVSDEGDVAPLGAKSWTVSADFKTFEFEIDNSKKFSDGSELTSYDYKRSWQEALLLSPKSNNNSLLDVLYKVVGFEDFEKSKNIVGLETPSKSKLIIHFKTPFRMAIDHLQGNRFSAFKQINSDTFIGTGCYVIKEITKEHLSLRGNPFHSLCRDSQPIELSIVKPSDAVSAIENNIIDVFAYGFSSTLSKFPEEQNITSISGFEASHETLILNGISGRFFSDSRFRKAFNFLIQKEFDRVNLTFKNPSMIRREAQVYLPFQAGHLDNEFIEKQICEGSKFVEELINQSKLHPLRVFTIEGRQWVIDLIKKAGVEVATDSKALTREEVIEAYYKTNAPDILVMAFSLSGNDPDNIYHALGKSGAIASKMTVRPKVQELLETGREITDLQKLDQHYKNVSLAILEEVPFVHLGFSKAFSMYRSDKIKTKTNIVRRNFGHLNIYERK